jgi:hypothetical protein
MTLTEKIEKIKKGLEGDAVTGEARKALEKALENALQQQAEQAPPVEVERVVAKKPSMRGGSSAAPFSLSNWPLVKKMMPIHQQKVVKEFGEEREDILNGVEIMLSKIPSLRNNKEQIVYAHYFYGQSDWFILEYDKEGDLFFGFTILNGDSINAELGYSSIEELQNSSRIELDFYWTVKPLSQAKAEADPEMWGSAVVAPKADDENKDVALISKLFAEGDASIIPKSSEVDKDDADINDLVNALQLSLTYLLPNDQKAAEKAIKSFGFEPIPKGEITYSISEYDYRINIMKKGLEGNAINTLDEGVKVLLELAIKNAEYLKEGNVQAKDDFNNTAIAEKEQETVTPTILPSDCAVTRNAKQNGVEIRFPKQPAPDKIETLKRKGFRWSSFNKVWYAKYNEALHKWAIDFCNETAQTDNPADMTTVASPTERLITSASLTQKGRVPQNLLKSEIEAGKLEVAVYRRFDGMTDSNEYIDKEDYNWVQASMDLDYDDIGLLKEGEVNKHWSDSILLKENGQINLGNLVFRYKEGIKNAEYKPQKTKEDVMQKDNILPEVFTPAINEPVIMDEESKELEIPELIPFKFDINTSKAEAKGMPITVINSDFDNLSREKRDLLQLLGFTNKSTSGKMFIREVFEGSVSTPLKERIIKALTDQKMPLLQDKINSIAKAASPEELYEWWPIIKELDLSKYSDKVTKMVKTPYFELEIGENITLKTDYNPDVVIEAKKLNARWDSYSKIWIFDARDLDRIKKFLREIFGTDGEAATKMVDVYVNLDKIPRKAYTSNYGQAVFALGRQLAHRKYRDKSVILGTNVIIHSGGFPDRGGSANSPRLEAYDDTILLVRDVPVVVVEKDELNCEGCYEIVGEKKPKQNEGVKIETLAKAKWQPDLMWTPQNTIVGKKRNINLPNGEKHEAQYAVVDLDTILASHNEETFADTPGYPRNSAGNNLNDRNYATDRAAQQLVEDYAQNLNPELLISTNSTPEGTPIINRDRIVVSGNNRTMSLKLAAKKYPEKYHEYRKFLVNELADFGIGEDVELMKNPVLVRIDYDFGELTTTNMAKYNASSMKSKSPVDKAAELATTLREQILCETNIPQIIAEFDTLSDFYASASAVRRMISAMQQCSVLNEQDMPAYVENGFFTNDGKTLLETILAALILEPDTLRIANRDGVKALRQCVVNALAVLIANKNLSNQSSLIKYINEAIRYQGDIVSSGLSWENFVNQISIFDNEKVSCNAVYINRLMNQGQKVFRNAIQAYNNSQSNAGGAALFQSEIVTPDESFKGYIISRIPAEDIKRIEMYCGGTKGAAPAPSAPVAAQVVSKTVLKTRLKIIEKMLEIDPSNTVLKTRLKIVTKMLA